MKKRLPAFLLAIIVLLTAFPCPSFAEEIDGLAYTLSDDETYYIISGYSGSAEELILPSEYNQLPIKEIGFFAFFECTSLVSVTIPEGYTVIGISAFNGCSNLKTVRIPETVESICLGAFKYCSSLETVNLPKKLTAIESAVFQDCSSLATLSFPDSLTSIESDAFSGCKVLREISVPKSLTSISNTAFDSCQELNSIIVHKENPAYKGSGNCLIEISTKTLIKGSNNSIIPDDGTVTTIGKNAFYGCTNFEKIIIPEGITAINDAAFRNCSALVSIILPTSLTKIGNSAFRACINLPSIIIPYNVSKIGDYAFDYCKSLTDIYCIVDSKPSGWSSKWNNDVDATIHWRASYMTDDFLYTYNSNDKSYSISKCISSKKSIVIPEKIHSLPVTKIDAEAFKDHIYLTDISIPDSVTTISSNAFNGCIKLTEIHLPKSVNNIAITAFDNCTFLETITIAEDNPILGAISNCVIEKESKTLYFGCKGSFIPADDSVIAIGDYAFDTIDGLTSVVIPENIKNIGMHAFYGCKDLTSVTIENGLETIEKSVFEACSSLATVNIPESVTEIRGTAFGGCESLTTVLIPKNVTVMDSAVFSGCTGLTDIYCEVESIPSNWKEGWNENCSATVHWGYVREPEVIIGDINGDGVIGIYDYTVAKRTVMETYVVDFEGSNPLDVNGDGEVTANDYILIKRHVMQTYIIG